MAADTDDCSLEHEQQSEHSPDVVNNSERLGRFIYHEEQVDDTTGELKSGAFKMDEFIEPRRRGASVARVDHSDADGLHRLGQQFIAGREDRWIRGLGVSQTIKVRQISDTAGSRVFYVIDDGNPEYRTHALIVRSDAYRVQELTERVLRSKLKPFRERLREHFSPVRKIEEAY